MADTKAAPVRTRKISLKTLVSASEGGKPTDGPRAEYQFSNGRTYMAPQRGKRGVYEK